MQQIRAREEDLPRKKMSKRTNTAQVLAAYFEEKGHIYSPSEYKKAEDAPIRFAAIKKVFGSWNRMENIVRGFNIRNEQRAERAPSTDVDEVIRRNNAARAEYAEKMKAASENVDAKTAREAAAREHMEADKLRAATPQGAYENKMRKGGITSQDEKAKQEAVNQALAEEHAMLAQTGAGAALGKHLLGGVEDNDEKTRAIAEQNAMREKTKLMAATPLGAAEAKLMEDDTDGQLTREAEARVRAELRPYVPPVKEGTVDKAIDDATSKVRNEVRKVVKDAAGDENVLTDSVFKATLARAKNANDLNKPVEVTDIPEDVRATMPPADQPPSDDFETPTEFKDKDGNVVATVDKESEEREKNASTKRTEKAEQKDKQNSAAKPADKKAENASKPADKK